MEVVILKIGSKGRRRPIEKRGMSGQNITNCILAVHKVRRHGADDKVGGRYPNGDEPNGENETRCPSIFVWVRRGMKILFCLITEKSS